MYHLAAPCLLFWQLIATTRKVMMHDGVRLWCAPPPPPLRLVCKRPFNFSNPHCQFVSLLLITPRVHPCHVCSPLLQPSFTSPPPNKIQVAGLWIGNAVNCVRVFPQKGVRYTLLLSPVLHWYMHFPTRCTTRWLLLYPLFLHLAPSIQTPAHTRAGDGN